MSVTPVTPELQQVVARLDTIIHELEGLRRQLTAPAAQAAPDAPKVRPAARPMAQRRIGKCRSIAM